MEHKESLKKLRFYDTTLIILIVSIISFFGMLFSTDPLISENLMYSIISIICSSSLIISFGIINFGMVYHLCKSRRYGWLFFIVITFLLGLGSLIMMAFYFFIMRKEFKEGRGVYS